MPNFTKKVAKQLITLLEKYVNEPSEAQLKLSPKNQEPRPMPSEAAIPDDAFCLSFQLQVQTVLKKSFASQCKSFRDYAERGGSFQKLTMQQPRSSTYADEKYLSLAAYLYLTSDIPLLKFLEQDLQYQYTFKDAYRGLAHPKSQTSLRSITYFLSRLPSNESFNESDMQELLRRAVWRGNLALVEVILHHARADVLKNNEAQIPLWSSAFSSTSVFPLSDTDAAILGVARRMIATFYFGFASSRECTCYAQPDREKLRYIDIAKRAGLSDAQCLEVAYSKQKLALRRMLDANLLSEPDVKEQFHALETASQRRSVTSRKL